MLSRKTNNNQDLNAYNDFKRDSKMRKTEENSNTASKSLLNCFKPMNNNINKNMQNVPSMSIVKSTNNLNNNNNNMSNMNNMINMSNIYNSSMNSSMTMNNSMNSYYQENRTQTMSHIRQLNPKNKNFIIPVLPSNFFSK